jgi:hypothetical protein
VSLDTRVANAAAKEVMLYPVTFLTTQSPYLYRGHVERYPTCFPSIIRDLHHGREKLYEFPEDEQIEFIVRQLRIHWFRSILASHPAMRWAKSGNPFGA